MATKWLDTLDVCEKECLELEQKLRLKNGKFGEEHYLEPLIRSPPRKINLTEKLSLNGHFTRIYWCEWAEDSQHVISVGHDGRLIIWDTTRPKWKRVINKGPGYYMACSISPLQTLCARGGLDNVVTLNNIQSSDGASVELLRHEGYISHCKFIDEYSIVSASGDGTVVIWDTELTRPKITYSAHTGDVMRVDVMENKFVFLSASCDATIRLWDVRTGDDGVHVWDGESDVDAIKLLPGDTAVGATESDDCYLVDLRTFKKVTDFKTKEGNCCYGVDIDFSNSGEHTFIAHDDGFRVWDTLSGDCIQTLTNNCSHSRVQCVSRSPDGQQIATGGWDFVLKIWHNKKTWRSVKSKN